MKYLLPALVILFLACGERAPAQKVPSTDFHEKVPIHHLDSLKAEYSNLILVDVRRPEETAEGKIEGALEVDYLADDFREKIQVLGKEDVIALYCRTGSRSSSAMDIMEELGFKYVFVLDGGYREWSERQKQ